MYTTCSISSVLADVAWGHGAVDPLTVFAVHHGAILYILETLLGWAVALRHQWWPFGSLFRPLLLNLLYLFELGFYLPAPLSR